jgi:hypothetical protein
MHIHILTIYSHLLYLVTLTLGSSLHVYVLAGTREGVELIYYANAVSMDCGIQRQRHVF